MERVWRSDLASECGAQSDAEGLRVTKTELGSCRVMRVQIRTEEASRRIGKPIGRYVTLECGDLRTTDRRELDRVRCALAVELREMAERMCGSRIGVGFSVLVVGLGNADVTPDSIGPETVRRLSVTRHLRRMDGALFSTLGLCEIAAIAPGVPGQTGMETAEAVRGVVREIGPDLVVAVDALAARSAERLARTVQLSDGGIRPGSGIGSRSLSLDPESVGAPVMALGIPTVVDAVTLVFDAVEQAGLGEYAAELETFFSEKRGYFVAPREIDLLVRAGAVLLAEAIEKAFSVTV